MGIDSKAVQKSGSAKVQKRKEKSPIVFYITGGGHELARRISGLYPDAELLKFNTSVFAGKWQDAENIICIMATGIVVRAMASLWSSIWLSKSTGVLPACLASRSCKVLRFL